MYSTSETDDTPSDSIPDTIKDAVISWFNKHLTTEMDIPDALSEGVRNGDYVFRITKAQVEHSKITLELETEDGMGLTFYGERDEDGSIIYCDPWTHFEEFVGNEKRLLEMLKKVKPQIDSYSDTMYLEGTEYLENNRVPPIYENKWGTSTWFYSTRVNPKFCFMASKKNLRVQYTYVYCTRTVCTM